MNLRSTLPWHQKGFSLIEMAIVLAIVGLLLGGLLPTISGQMEQRHVSDTRKQLVEIQQALIGFAIINGRLPCPALSTTPTGSSTAGVETSTCAAPNNGGVLPWVTLGVSETDAWGRRFTYRVTPAFATVTPTPFQLNTPGILNVGLTWLNTDVGAASGVPAIVVSHGTNGLGAVMPNGTQTPPIPALSSDEGDNTISSNDNHFVSHDITPNFDDLVIWISPNVLFNRMVAAGKLP